MNKCRDTKYIWDICEYNSLKTAKCIDSNSITKVIRVIYMIQISTKTDH